MKLVKNQKLKVISLIDMVSVNAKVVQKNITGLYNVTTPEVITKQALADRAIKRLGIINQD